MADNKYLEFLDPVTSPGINQSRAPFFRPGRYSGFDKWDPAHGVGSLGIKVYHDNSKALTITSGLTNQGNPYGVLTTPQGLVFLSFMEEGALDSDIGLTLHHINPATQYYLFWAKYEWQEAGEGGSNLIYGITNITSGMGSLAYSGDNIYSPTGEAGWITLLASPETQVALGVFKVTSGDVYDYNRVTYYPRIAWEHIFLLGSHGDWEFFENMVREKGSHDRFIELYEPIPGAKGLRIGVEGSPFKGLELAVIAGFTGGAFYGDNFVLASGSYNPNQDNSVVPKSYVDNLTSFSAWITPTLLNGYSTASAPSGHNAIEPLRYRVSNSHIEIHGYLSKSSTGTGTIVFNLHPDHVPARGSLFGVTAYTPSGTILLKSLYIRTAGTVDIPDIFTGDSFFLNLLIPRT